MAKLIGTDPNQVPTNADLGTMAYQDAENPRLNNVVISGTPNDDADGTLLRVKRGPSESGTWATVAIEAQTANGNSRIAFVNDIEPSPTDAHGMIDFEHQTNRLHFFVDGSEAAHFNSSGNLAFPNGQGIDLSASEGSGASSSVLDDYEEGSFTPTVYAHNGSLTPTYVTANTYGRYTKIGQLVSFDLEVRTSGTSGANNGYLRIGGLPFPSPSDFHQPIFATSLYRIAFDTNYIYTAEFASASSTVLYIRESRNNATSSEMPSSAWSASNPTLIRISGSYRTS